MRNKEIGARQAVPLTWNGRPQTVAGTTDTTLSWLLIWEARLLEAMPGVCAWIVVLAPIWLTLVDPLAGMTLVSVSIAVFAVKVLRYGVNALANRGRLLAGARIDWQAALDQHANWTEHRLILLIRAYRESNRAMLRDTLTSIWESRWPRQGDELRNVEVVFATETTDPVTPPLVESLAEEFAGRLRIRQIPHPPEPHVLPGPSSAMHYAGRVLHREALAAGLDPRRVVVADFDADTIFHPSYLACLLSTFLADPDRDRHVYQPIVLFTLDYWRAPLHSRLAAVSQSALTLGWLQAPEIAFTGAAGSLALYQSVDFWPTSSHSQDSGVDLKLRMRYGRQFKVVGLPVPLKVYPVMIVGRPNDLVGRAKAYLRSFQLVFRQSARWREGPLDEFVEAARQGRPWLTLHRFWNGLERDTLTILPGLGILFVRLIGEQLYVGYDLTTLGTVIAIVLTPLSFLGLSVYLLLVSNASFVAPAATPRRLLLELIQFWLVISIYLPILTAFAGLKTSTAYALGRRPVGHYTPTPK
ncbi:MAG: glycosyltransferase family 2 protein [Chloroflexi bacterium]|nr:glycosyltransferase family 2 protein [Chloroflexota bacterium]